MSDLRGVNLAPRWRKTAARRAGRRRAWMTGCTAYAALLIVAYGVCYGQWHTAGAHVHDKLADTMRRIDETGSAISHTTARIADSRLALRVNRIFSDRPDWSVILQLVASTLGEDLVLRECKLVRAAAGSADAASKTPSASREMILHLRGFARSQTAISKYALRLEQTSLFARVTVLETRREPFLTSESVAFTLACAIHGS